MAKDLITISQEDFEKSLPRISTGELKKLIEGIYSLKWDAGHKWPVEWVLDIERVIVTGKQCAVRLLYATKSLDEYYSIIKSSKQTPDMFVSAITYDKLRK